MKKPVLLLIPFFLLISVAAYGQNLAKIWNQAVEETRTAEEYYRESHEILVTLNWGEISWISREEAETHLRYFDLLQASAREGAALAGMAQASFGKADTSWRCLIDITKESSPENWATATYNAGVTADNGRKCGEMRLEYERLLGLMGEIIDELNRYLAETP
jgi:hypothetical protein